MSEGNRRRNVVTVEAVASCCAESGAFPLAHPALTQMPAELRGAKARGELTQEAASGVVAVRRGRTRKSALDSAAPWAWRASNAGQAVELKSHLETARALVETGWTLLEVVADGTLWGWRLRMSLTTILGEPLANWDQAKGRTQGERLALVERALAELIPTTPAGGWTVTDGGGE